MKKVMAFVLAAAMVVAAMAVQAKAGMKAAYPVSIGTNTASGSLGTARNSEDTVQYIGCTLRAIGIDRIVSCGARDAEGQSLSCSTTNPLMADVAAAINGDSYVSFTRNESGSCVSLSVSNASHWEPKR